MVVDLSDNLLVDLLAGLWYALLIGLGHDPIWRMGAWYIFFYLLRDIIGRDRNFQILDKEYL